MALNTIHVSFDGQNETITKKRYQYDKGQVCVFDDVELPEAYKVIFSNNLTGENSIPMIGDENGVKVPDDFFLTGLTIYGWIYLSEGNDDGQTVKHFTIPIEKRVHETDEEPTPEEQTEIEQAIVALNNAVAKTAADVVTTTEKAEQAATSAQSAATSAEEASGYLEGVTAKANEAAASASSAEQSATTASQKAAETAAGVSRAEQAAEGAEAAKTAAQSAQTAAEGYAGAAGTSAQAASTSATQAAGSATSASGFADVANTSAQAAASSATTASTKATEAAQSASTASTAATNAINAKTAAETAQGKAEDAQEAAETAQEAAETAVESVQGKSEQIDQNTEDIGDLKAYINQLILMPSYTKSGVVVTDTVMDSYPLVAVTNEYATKVTVSGSNLWDEQTRIGNYGENSGSYNSSGTNLCNANPIRVNPNTKYFFAKPSNIAAIVFSYNELYGKAAMADTYLGYQSVAKNTNIFTTPNDATYINFYMGGAYGQTYNNDIGINYPITVDQYIAANHQDIIVNNQIAHFHGTGEPFNVFANDGAITIGADNFSVNLLENVFFVGGAIRNTGSGWAFILNSAHTPLNCLSVSVQNGDIIITFTKTASKVIGFTICPDETFAQNYTIGASVGLNNAVCRIYQGGTAVDASTVSSNSGNFWFLGIMQI